MAKAKTTPVQAPRAPSAISELSEANVMSVYSGRDGKCCCGCAGKHSYTEAHRAVAGENRGYAVDDDDVNDRMVRRVIKLIKENEAEAEDNGDHVSLVVGTRLYVAYRLPTSV